jgi:hypothetical protein
LIVLGLSCAVLQVSAQETLPTERRAPIIKGRSERQANTAVPRLIRISNTFHPVNGLAASPVESVTLSIYREELGGTPVWQETQNVDVDSEGRYTVLMGSTLTDGIPVDLFTSTDPLWLGVQFNRTREIEQPRQRLSSVPYALKAVDAETLGGKPASAYMLTPVEGGTAPVTSTAGGAGEATAKLGAPTPKFAPPGATRISDNYIPVYYSGLAYNSQIYQFDNTYPLIGSNIGIGTTTPDAPLVVSAQVFNGPVSYITSSQPGGGFGIYNSNGNASSRNWSLVGNFARFGDFSINQSLTQGGNPFLGASNSRLYIDPSGNVGVGSVFPRAPLHVYNRQNAVTSIVVDNDGTSSGVGQGISFNYGNVGTLGGIAHYYDGNWKMGFKVWNGAATQMLTVTDAGRVGVLNSSPSCTLDVTGDINFTTALRYQGSSLLSFGLGGPGFGSTGFGVLAFNSTASGSGNTAFGYRVLTSVTSASGNAGMGQFALNSTTTGALNTGIGNAALRQNTTGSDNSALGNLALLNNTTGGSNTGLGSRALSNHTTGNNNIAVGYNAGSQVTANSNNIHIGHAGTASDSGTIRIGTSGTQTEFYVAGVTGVTTTNSAVPVLIDTTTGQLGVASSSRRYKEDIQDMAEASEGLMRLRPVTYRYQKAFTDGSKPVQYGLIAEEVEEVYPDLVAHSADGKIETVKYQVLDSMLLNEVQKQQAKIRTQETQIRFLEERLAKLEAAINLK